MTKRLFDFIGSLLGLIVLSPLSLLLALLIKLDSPGPVFYRGVRIGRFGKPFRIFKFRTMVMNADKIGGPATPDGDQRVTRMGAFLRNYKLDELPQLLNVLKGEMSLVGPRPEHDFYFQYYSKEEKDAVLSVRPGMTDYGSLHFHDEGKLIVGADPSAVYIQNIKPEKVRLQLKYIRNQSLMRDVQIIFGTIAIILRTRLHRKESHGV